MVDALKSSHSIKHDVEWSSQAVFTTCSWSLVWLTSLCRFSSTLADSTPLGSEFCPYVWCNNHWLCFFSFCRSCHFPACWYQRVRLVLLFSNPITCWCVLVAIVPLPTSALQFVSFRACFLAWHIWPWVLFLPSTWQQVRWNKTMSSSDADYKFVTSNATTALFPGCERHWRVESILTCFVLFGCFPVSLSMWVDALCLVEAHQILLISPRWLCLFHRCSTWAGAWS